MNAVGNSYVRATLLPLLCRFGAISATLTCCVLLALALQVADDPTRITIAQLLTVLFLAIVDGGIVFLALALVSATVLKARRVLERLVPCVAVAALAIPGLLLLIHYFHYLEYGSSFDVDLSQHLSLAGLRVATTFHYGLYLLAVVLIEALIVAAAVAAVKLSPKRFSIALSVQAVLAFSLLSLVASARTPPVIEAPPARQLTEVDMGLQVNSSLLTVSTLMRAYDEAPDLADGPRNPRTQPADTSSLLDEYEPTEQSWLAPGCLYSSATSRFDPPFRHIILIILESVMSQDLHYYNPSAIKKDWTPFLDQLASTATRIDEYVAVSAPSQRALHSMFYSHPFHFKTSRNLPTVFTELSRSGYETYFFRGTTGRYGNLQRIYSDSFRMDHFVEEDGLAGRYDRVWEWGIGDRQLYRAVLDVLRANRDQRVFAAIELANTHNPFLLEAVDDIEDFPSTMRRWHFRRALYDSSQLLAEFLRALRKSKLFDRNTVVLITSDHQRGHRTGTLPFFIVPGGQRSLPEVVPKRPASHVDLGPTILDLAGRNPPREFLGRSVFHAFCPGVAMEYRFLGSWQGVWTLSSGASSHVLEVSIETDAIAATLQEREEDPSADSPVEDTINQWLRWKLQAGG